MINWFLAILAGAVQGITEFLPISSSAHLIILQDLFNFELESNLTFNVALHLGTLLALIIFFYFDIIQLIKNFSASIFNSDLKNKFEQRLPWLIILGTIPAALIGFLFEDFVDEVLHSSNWSVIIIVVMLISVGALFLIMEKKVKQTKDISDINWKNSLLIGLAQAIALIPGTSRSGITIIAGLSQGLKREQAARFSFLLSIPIVAGASLKKMFDVYYIGGLDLPMFGLGIASSFIVGYLALGLLLKYLSSNSLKVFAYYRFGLAVFLILWLFWR
jgi:undecaprenyl-diphosphatase